MCQSHYLNNSGSQGKSLASGYFLVLCRTLNSDISTNMTRLTSKIDTHDENIKSVIATSNDTLKNAINAKGCVKSVQFINQWIKTTIDNGMYTIQANINQVDPSKSIVLFNEIKWYIRNPGDFGDNSLGHIDNLFELDSIESRCVKFRYHRTVDIASSSSLYHVVFQLVEFY